MTTIELSNKTLLGVFKALKKQYQDYCTAQWDAGLLSDDYFTWLEYELGE